MRKVLIIHHGRGVGGGLIALIGLINELKNSYDVQVFSIFNSEAIEYISKTGVHVITPRLSFYLKYYEIFVCSDASYFRVINSLRKLKNFILYFFSKYYYAPKELKELSLDYDIVYLNSTFISDWSLAAKRLNKKVVIHIREPLSKGIIGLGRFIIIKTINKYCDRVIAITKDNADRVGLPNKTKVIYDPVVEDGRCMLEEVEVDPTFKYFLYLGGMARIKGFEQMVESLAWVDEGIKIFFLGHEMQCADEGVKGRLRRYIDPYFRKHELLVSKLKSSSKVVYVGQTDNVFEYYKKSIALLSPFSKPHASLPILEAFSLGIPVITSNVQGMEELVDGKNGFLFENNNPKSLANRINQMAMLTEIERQQMQKACLATYEHIRNNSENVSSILCGL